MAHLGSLINLMELRVNKLFIQQMVEFWDTTMVNFRFLDFEITPTFEEISQIANLPLAGWATLAPQATSGSDFLRSLGLRIGSGLRIVEAGWANLGYVFEKFGRRER